MRNRGTVAAPARSAWACSCPTNDTIDPGDRPPAHHAAGDAGLAAGAQATVTARVTLPADVAPGAYFFGAFADVGQVIDEVDEANNGLAGPNGIQVVGPDLVVPPSTDRSPPRRDRCWPSRSPSRTRRRRRARPPPSRVAFYLSPDPRRRAPACGWASAQMNALAAGREPDADAAAHGARNISPGSYFLAAFADDESQVAESDEGNNGFNPSAALDIVRPTSRSRR